MTTTISTAFTIKLRQLSSGSSPTPPPTWDRIGLRLGPTPTSRSYPTDAPMPPASLPERIAALPKAELHLHLEGSIQPATVCALTARHGAAVTEEEVRRRSAYPDFLDFLESFKWVTSFLREPQDYALIARD